MTERRDSVVTPERFASGLTFEQYLAFIGTPDNLAREGSASGPRRDQTAAMRAWYEANRLTDAQAAAIRWLAGQPGGPAKVLVIAEEWSSDCRRDVPVLARVAEAGGMELRIVTRDGPALQRERAAEPGRGAGQQCRPHGGVPERQERPDVAVDPRRRLLHEGSRVPLPLHRVPGDLSQGPAGPGPHPLPAARGDDRRRRGRAPTASSALYSSRPSFASGRARPSTRSSARCTGGSSWGRTARARCPSPGCAVSRCTTRRRARAFRWSGATSSAAIIAPGSRRCATSRAGIASSPSGHTPNIEEPGLFNLHVAEFLAAVERGRWAGWTTQTTST